MEHSDNFDADMKHFEDEQKTWHEKGKMNAALLPRDKKEQVRRDLLWQKVALSAGKESETQTFGSWKSSSERHHVVASSVREWAARWEPGSREGMILYGPVGTGKDHLAIAAMRHCVLLKGAKAGWLFGRDFFAERRDRIDQRLAERDLIARYTHYDILTISDPLPVVGNMSADQADLLFRLIFLRTQRQRATIVTLNVADDREGETRLGIPTWDRLRDNAWQIHCYWASYRKPARIV